MIDASAVRQLKRRSDQLDQAIEDFRCARLTAQKLKWMLIGAAINTAMLLAGAMLVH